MSIGIPLYNLADNEQVRISRLEEKHVVKYFKTHRHKYYEIVIITSVIEGNYTHNIDFISYPLISGKVYFIAPGQTHAWGTDTYNKEYKGYIITFNEAFLLSGNEVLEQNLFKLFNPLDMNPFLDYNPKELDTTFPTLKIFETEYRKTENKDFSILRALLESLVFYMANLKFETIPRIDVNCQRLVELRKDIEAFYKSEKSVEFYARRVELSAKRLNEISKEIAGETVTQILHHRLILEAKREIVSGMKTFQQISDDLGFENPSYFARFFKKHEKISPTEFSKNLFK